MTLPDESSPFSEMLDMKEARMERSKRVITVFPGTSESTSPPSLSKRLSRFITSLEKCLPRIYSGLLVASNAHSPCFQALRIIEHLQGAQ